MSQAVEILRGVAKIPFEEDVIEDSDECRVVTRFVPIGESPAVSERHLVDISRCIRGHRSLEL